MKRGLGIVKCGSCGKYTIAAWPGHKYKMPCPTCGATMNIHRQRLKKFEAFKERKEGTT